MGASDEGEGALQAMVERMRDSKRGESAAIVVCVIAFAVMGCVGGILNASCILAWPNTTASLGRFPR